MKLLTLLPSLMLSCTFTGYLVHHFKNTSIPVVDPPFSVSTCGGRQQGGAGQFTNFLAHLWLYVDGPPTKGGSLMGDRWAGLRVLNH